MIVSPFKRGTVLQFRPRNPRPDDEVLLDRDREDAIQRMADQVFEDLEWERVKSGWIRRGDRQEPL
jgi:hypothetical protein